MGKLNLGHCRILTHQIEVDYDQSTLLSWGNGHFHVKERFLARDAKEFTDYPESPTMSRFFFFLAVMRLCCCTQAFCS